MPSLNKVMLIGYVVRDMQLRSKTTGGTYGDIDLAMSRVIRMQDGSEKEETAFVSATTYGNLAVLCSQTLHKGSRVYVEGRLYQSTWVDKTTNQQRSKLRVAVERLLFLSPKDHQMHEVGELGSEAAAIQARLQQAGNGQQNARSGNSDRRTMAVAESVEPFAVGDTE